MYSHIFIEKILEILFTKGTFQNQLYFPLRGLFYKLSVCVHDLCKMMRLNYRVILEVSII